MSDFLSPAVDTLIYRKQLRSNPLSRAEAETDLKLLMPFENDPRHPYSFPFTKLAYEKTQQAGVIVTHRQDVHFFAALGSCVVIFGLTWRVLATKISARPLMLYLLWPALSLGTAVTWGYIGAWPIKERFDRAAINLPKAKSLRAEALQDLKLKAQNLRLYISFAHPVQMWENGTFNAARTFQHKQKIQRNLEAYGLQAEESKEFVEELFRPDYVSGWQNNHRLQLDVEEEDIC